MEGHLVYFPTGIKVRWRTGAKKNRILRRWKSNMVGLVVRRKLMEDKDISDADWEDDQYDNRK